CRRCRTALEQALSALAAAASYRPADSEATSLWPALERRIAGHRASKSSRWLSVATALGDRWFRAWRSLEGDRPLRQAWMRDTWRDALTGLRRPGADPKLRPALITGFSLAAVALFVVLFGIPGWRRQGVDARSTITADSTPLVDDAAPPAPLDQQALEASGAD